MVLCSHLLYILSDSMQDSLRKERKVTLRISRISYFWEKVSDTLSRVFVWWVFLLKVPKLVVNIN